ncbi:ABC transporter permease subunit [Leifsonia sp. Root112D2]|jgi:arabinogalactan oligomer/maltooligosaccharide transport system permease protein|uniref:ABC transporter permease subunit n=1 Tax=Leifsonia sp. Root112D2 TaxID=1736426 RepID=UPI0006F86407|nr:ABC transporter permease subunit [Leifsonia sp. Root112D2]KQV06342.1 maltose ABC transporter permease [Leifsonia sp. Root112D2]
MAPETSTAKRAARQTAPENSPRRDRSSALSRSGIGGLVAKIILLGLLDAVAVWAVIVMIGLGMWVPVVITVLITGVINWIYLGRGKRLPAKYLTPGVAFLLVFQVFVVLFSGYIAFTNYGDGHNSTKQDAIAAISQSGQKRVPNSPAYQLSILQKDGTFYMLTTAPDGVVAVGTTGEPLKAVTDFKANSVGLASGLPGYTTLDLSTILDNQSAITGLLVPVSSNPADGQLRTDDASTAYVYKADVVYDATSDAFTSTNGTVYTDNGNGEFATADGGKALSPGWKINVGVANFVKAFTSDQLAGPLWRVILWTFTFAILSVLTTFALGLFLATVLNHPRLRGKKIYRVLVILPYAFPVFLSGLLWAGLLNPQFGFVNQVLFGGAEIPWLTDTWLAKISVLVVNLWLGYPYMFLVCTGALQSLPEEVDEAARVDGASPWRIFRSVKLPLLLVSVAPLLIASFAFNFNNFNVIYMLTKGWPRFTDTTFDIGSTDLLITMVYKVAFGQGGARDYGLASALSILIFVLVAIISIIAFRRTKALEEIN